MSHLVWKTEDRPLRYVQALPILAALNLHGLLHGRYLMVVPAALALLVGIRRNWRLEFGEAAIAIGAVAGAALGFGYGLFVPPPEGPVPASLLAPMCGALVPLCVVAALSGARTYAWVFAWLLATLSSYVHQTTVAGLASLAVLVLTTLVAAALSQGARVRRRPAAFAGMLAVALVSGAGTWGVGQGLLASQGFLIGLVGGGLDSLIERLRDVAEFSMPKSMYVGARGHVPDSKKALFEVSGALPTYLRGAVMDRFDGMQWTTSAELEAATPDLAALPAPRTRAEISLKFLLSPGDRLPVPAGVREVRGATARPLGGWVLGVTEGLRGKTVEVSSDGDRVLPPEPRPGEALVQLPPELKEALAPLGAGIVGAAATSRAKAEAIERFFQANFRYSLTAELMGREHPLVVLIKERRPAYCAYFASAMAALLRSQGVPARLVGGFALEETNPLTGASVVRERDAHAWVEAWLEDEGRFVAFDPTPGDSRVEALGLERGALGIVADALSAWIDDQVMEFKHSPSEYVLKLATSKYLWGFLLLLVGWRVSLRFRGKRSQAQRGAMVAGDERLLELYGRYQRILSKGAGVEAALSETDDSVVERVRRGRGEGAGKAAERFVVAYREARYRGEKWEPEALQKALAEVERELANPRA